MILSFGAFATCAIGSSLRYENLEFIPWHDEETEKAMAKQENYY